VHVVLIEVVVDEADRSPPSADLPLQKHSVLGYGTSAGAYEDARIGSVKRYVELAVELHRDMWTDRERRPPAVVASAVCMSVASTNRTYDSGHQLISFPLSVHRTALKQGYSLLLTGIMLLCTRNSIGEMTNLIS
jgi:hypothetical protein